MAVAPHMAPAQAGAINIYIYIERERERERYWGYRGVIFGVILG